MNENDIERIPLSLRVGIDENNSIHIVLEGFEDEADAEEYAEYLSEMLPLLMFESDVEH